MLITDTTTTGDDALRRAAESGRPWAYWSRPGESDGRVRGQLATRRFDAPRDELVGPDDYTARVAAALEAIDAGHVDKVVVAREEVMPAADVAATIEELRWRFPNCWVFAVSDGVDTFLGATPELLARVRGRELQTCALAGTSAPGDEAGLRTEKNLREHRLVVDAIRHRLDGLCEEISTTAPPTTMRLANVQHLRTPITATLRDGVSARDVVDALHPTPAVCGSPRVAARQLIAQLEPFDRGLYAGVIGFEGDHDSEFVVALRCALCTPESTRVYAGAGVVSGSTPKDEDAETKAKLRAITEALRYR